MARFQLSAQAFLFGLPSVIRIEPGEIENLTLSHPGVNRHRDDSLHPFVTFKFLEQPSSSKVRQRIRQVHSVPPSQ